MSQISEHLGFTPHIFVKKIAWDGWLATVEECPLIRSIKATAAAAVEDVRRQLERKQ